VQIDEFIEKYDALHGPLQIATGRLKRTAKQTARQRSRSEGGAGAGAGAGAAADPSQAKTKWTEQDIVRLRKLRAAGKTWKQIGKELGRTSRAVSGKWHVRALWNLHSWRRCPERFGGLQELNSA
jgi:hypothetical protein